MKRSLCKGRWRSKGDSGRPRTRWWDNYSGKSGQTSHRNNQDNDWVLNQVNTKMSLLNFIDKGKLTYFGHIVRADNSLEKIIRQGKVEGKRGTWKTQKKMVGQYSGKSGEDLP